MRIAPPDGRGLSHNRYRDFNVPPAGLDLDNRAAQARTILNEVVSARPSLLQGPLTVLGDKAHVIIANPNGITVDGAVFRNTAGLALITGRLRDQTAGFRVDGGEILVRGKGLTAAMSRIDMIARRIRVKGKVEAAETHAIRMSAGSSIVTLSPDAPIENPASLLDVKPAGETSDGIAVTLEAGAALKGGAITITVNDKGPGVRIEGQIAALQDAVSIEASGDVTVSDARIDAEQYIHVKGGEVRLESRQSRTSLTSRQSGIKLDASGNITAYGVSLSGQQRAQVGFDALGAVSLRAGGDLIFTAGHDGQRGQVSGGAHGVEFNAAGSLRLSQQDQTSEGPAYFRAERDISFDDFSLGAGANVNIETAAGTVTANDAEIVAASSLFVVSSALNIRSGSRRRSRLVAETGGIMIETTGDVVNEGGLVQGARRIRGLSTSQGGITLLIGGRLVNRTLNDAQIASFYAETEDLHIRTTGGILNESGRLLSNADLRIDSEGTVENRANITGDGFSDRMRGPQPFLWSHTRVYDYGQLAAGNEVGQIRAQGAVNISARSLVNVGSDILGLDVRIDTEEEILNASQVLGTTWMKRRCILFFCTYKGGSDARLEDAIIMATNGLNISSGSQFVNLGSELQARSGLSIRAPKIAFQAITWQSFYARSGGLSSFFTGRWGRLFLLYQGGSILVLDGSLELDAAEDIPAVATAISARNIDLANGHELRHLDEPPGLWRANEVRIGLWPFSQF